MIRVLDRHKLEFVAGLKRLEVLAKRVPNQFEPLPFDTRNDQHVRPPPREFEET